MEWASASTLWGWKGLLCLWPVGVMSLPLASAVHASRCRRAGGFTGKWG